MTTSGTILRAKARATSMFAVSLVLVLASAASGQEAAQQDDPASQPPAAPAAPQDESAAGGETAALAAALEDIATSELEIRLAPLTVGELEALTAAAMARVREAADELATALVEQLRAHGAPGEGGDGGQAAAVDERVASLLARRSELVTRVESVLAALEQKGGDVQASRRYLTVVRAMEPQPSVAAAQAEASAGGQAETETGQLVTQMIAAVRDEAPVHERAEPWTVPRDELELELQPLRMAEVEARMQAWLEILQREVRRRIRIDIALSRATDAAQRSTLAERSAEQQRVVQAVLHHVQVVVAAFEARGGDATEARSYVATATGQKLALTDPAVLYAQALAWLRSPDGGLRVALDIAQFLAILVAFWLLSRLLGKATARAVERLPKASTLLRKFIVGIVKRITLVIGLVVAVGALGVNITPLVAAIGAAGLVIGLALQGTLSNFASGILILVYRPYDVGDVINGGGVTGKVESMNLVTTSILTFDNQVMIVPNNELWNNVITNVTGRDTRRVDLEFGIGYGDDIAQAVAILEDELRRHPKVLAEPAPLVRVHKLGDSSVNLIARPWSRTGDYWDVYWDLMRSVKERFDAEGVNIPFPQRDLHLPGTIEVRLAKDSEGGGRGGPA